MKRFLVFLLRLYKGAVSPYWPAACRYQPTCSEYAQEAITTHGSLAGTWLAVRRLARCGPWHAGGFDPVPDPKPGSTKSRQIVARSA